MRRPEWVLPETVIALHEQLLAAFQNAPPHPDALSSSEREGWAGASDRCPPRPHATPFGPPDPARDVTVSTTSATSTPIPYITKSSGSKVRPSIGIPNP